MISGANFDSATIDKPMLVEFYYNSCSACNANASKVSMVAKEFIATAQVVDFGYDCKQSSYESWIQKHKPKYPVLMGCDSPIFDSVPVAAYPTTLIVDKNKNIVYKTVGTWSNTTMNAIRAKLRQLSKQQ
jgi:Fe-S cluster assembly scaffold protein SufB